MRSDKMLKRRLISVDSNRFCSAEMTNNEGLLKSISCMTEEDEALSSLASVGASEAPVDTRDAIAVEEVEVETEAVVESEMDCVTGVGRDGEVAA